MASTDDEIRMTLRIPETLRDQLREAGEASRRSINAEIVHRLEASFGQEGSQSEVPMSEVMVLPPGLSDDDLVEAFEEASRKALQITMARLGITTRKFDENDK